MVIIIFRKMPGLRCVLLYAEEGQCFTQLDQLIKMIQEAELVHPASRALLPWLFRAATLSRVLAVVSPGMYTTDALE